MGTVHDSVAVACRSYVFRVYLEPQTNGCPCCGCWTECGSGFRYVDDANVHAFKRVEHGELIAEDEEGEIRCLLPGGAYLVMPTAHPVIGEEAWFWGEDKPPHKQLHHVNACDGSSREVVRETCLPSL
jgi:hypothetical protein